MTQHLHRQMLSAARGGLLERERELAILEATIAEVAAGGSRVALAQGPAGIGKTRLLTEARRRAAEAGISTLWARGGAFERVFAFGVVRQLFEPALVDDERRQRALSGPAAAARDVFAFDGDGSAPDGDISFAVLHGLYWLTVNLCADGPLALVVDDLHWCDAASVRFLAYLAHRLDGLPLLVLGGLRPSEFGADEALIAELAADPATIVVQPRRLSQSAAAELVRERLGTPAEAEFSRACWAATGGNPLLLQELVRGLEAEGVAPDASHARMVSELGPRAAGRSVLVRLARLPEAAVKMARAAAVLGDGSDLRAVAELAAISERDAIAATFALVRAEILQDAPTAGFVHPLVGAAVHHDIAPVERTLLHERAARLLAERAAPVEQVAAHLLAIPPRGDGWVAERLTEAARASLRRGAPEGAADFLRRALTEPPRGDLRTEVLLELAPLSSAPEAAAQLAEAHAALEDPRARAVAAQGLARALLFTGRPVEAAELARRTTAELPPGVEDLGRALEAFEAMTVFFGVGDPATLARLHGHRTLPLAPGLGAKMLAAAAAQEWAYAGGTSDACAELSLQALSGGELIVADAFLFGVVAIITLVLADRTEADDAWQAVAAEAHRRGSLFSKCAISLWRGFTLYWWGDLVDAEESLRTAARELELWGFGGPESHCAAFLSAVLRERGRLGEARRALQLAADPGDNSEGARFWLDSRIELLLAERRFDEALACSDDAAARFCFLRHPIDTPWRLHRAVALDALGRRQEALEGADEAIELARAWGAPRTMARALRIVGTLEREASIPRLRDAVDAAAGSTARLEHAKALAALGAALRRARRPTEAREPLRGAVELAQACGADALAKAARTDLYAAGGRPRARELTGPGALTASERRVAALAADGATNREIAQALYVTPKTIELHLGNAYRKLGIRSRRQLAGALAAS